MNTSTRTAATFTFIGRAIPAPLKRALRPVRSLAHDLRYRLRYGFPPPPIETDLVGYEALIEFIEQNRLLSVRGDVVEIGAFRGGGTYKLAKFLQAKGSQKKVYTIDCFDIQFDRTENTDGSTMAKFYEATLKGQSQKEIFERVTSGISNLFVIPEDSKMAAVPAETLCFGFVDGNHSDEYVRSDFYLVWNKLSPGGAIALHDYAYNLPNVTAAIDQLCLRNSTEIQAVQVDHVRHIIYIRKRLGAVQGLTQ